MKMIKFEKVLLYFAKLSRFESWLDIYSIRITMESAGKTAIEA